MPLQNIDFSNFAGPVNLGASDTKLTYPQLPIAGTTGFFNAGLTQAQIQSYVAQAQQTQQNQQTQLNRYGIEREPWIFTTYASITSSAQQIGGAGITSGYNTNFDPIYWTASPKQVTWNISQRASEDKNKSGTVLHVWRDRTRGTDYDDPKINMQFQSGSIMPTVNTSGTTIAPGLNNFYQFLQLVDQSKISVNGEPNTIHILYRSNIFPSMVITGLFDPQMVVQFTDNSDNPWKIESWSANFTIYSTIPKFKSFTDLKQMFQADPPRLDQNKATSTATKATPGQGGAGDFVPNQFISGVT
jgi:hypothetical protein